MNITYKGDTRPWLIDEQEMRRLLHDHAVSERDIERLKVTVQPRGIFSWWPINAQAYRAWRTIVLYTQGIESQEERTSCNRILCHEIKHYIDRTDPEMRRITVLSWLIGLLPFPIYIVLMLISVYVLHLGLWTLLLAPILYGFIFLAERQWYRINPKEQRARAFEEKANEYMLILPSEKQEEAQS